MSVAAVRAGNLIDAFASAADPAGAAQLLFDALAPLSPLSLNYQDVTLERPKTHGSATIAFLRPPTFDTRADGALILKLNPLPDASLRLRRPHAWSEAHFANRHAAGAYWEALGSFGYRSGLSIPAFEGRTLAAGITLSFRSDGFDPETQSALIMASSALIARARWTSAGRPRLSARERDCIAWVAEGKTDWEISQILSLSAATVHGYVESAKRKLGASNRPEAVGRWLIHERSAPAIEAQPAGLSLREEQCLFWIASGLTDKQIALRMRISPDTVRDHVDSARIKLNAATRAQAVARMIDTRG